MWLLRLVRHTPGHTRTADHAIRRHLSSTTLVVITCFQEKSLTLWRCYFWLWGSTIHWKAFVTLSWRKFIWLYSANVHIEPCNFEWDRHEKLLLISWSLGLWGLFLVLRRLNKRWLLIFLKHLLHFQEWPISWEVLTVLCTILREHLKLLDTKILELIQSILEIFLVKTVSI